MEQARREAEVAEAMAFLDRVLGALGGNVEMAATLTNAEWDSARHLQRASAELMASLLVRHCGGIAVSSERAGDLGIVLFHAGLEAGYRAGRLGALIERETPAV